MATRVGLLGPPLITVGDEPIWPQAGKTTALLLYLAYRVDWVSRVELVELFWRDTPESTARTNLRSLLTRTVSTRPYAQELEVEKTRVRWLVDTDVGEFQQAVIEGRHAEAYRLYRGELLQGFALEGSEGFDEWLAGERPLWTERWLASALEVCDQLEGAKQWAPAGEVLGRLLESDPFDESILRRRLVALANAGQPRQVHDAYERFRAWLAAEVEAEPEPETASIAASVEAGTYHRPAAYAEVANAPPRLPTPATEIVGREGERAHLAELLTGGRARLVTLTGPGGIGKTRLALAVAHDLSDDSNRDLRRAGDSRRQASEPQDDEAFPDGVGFAYCESLIEPEDLVTAIADAYGLPLIGPGEPRRQLLDYLSERRTLLVLDNLEQLRGRLWVLDEILEAAPGMSILTTSRELLGSRYEQVMDLTGLAVPPAEADAPTPRYQDLTAYDAVAMFVSRARRVREGFNLTEENSAAVVRICSLVAGMPLAIELASSWLRAVGPEEIAGEIGRSLDILAAAVPSEGDRHSSIRAVFDYSWSVLTRGERGVLARLSVFAGSFDLVAAKAVAGASVATLAALVNKSLLVRTADDRYRLHPLVRGYAAEKLADEGIEDNLAGVRAAYCEYFTSFLEARTAAFRGGDQLRAVNELAAEMDNLHAAWDWALEAGDAADLDRQLPALTPYYTFTSRFQEMFAMYTAAARRLRELAASDANDALLGLVLAHVGWSSMRLGRYQEAEAALFEAQSLRSSRVLGPRYPAGDPRLPLSLMASIRGDCEAAAAYGEAALEASLEHGNDLNERIAHYALARVAIAEERFEDAEGHVRQALESSELAEDRWFMGDCLLEIGDVAMGLGRPEDADAQYAKGLAICREFGNRSGMAEAINRRAGVALRQRDYDGAQRLYRDSLKVGEAVSDGREIARAECGLGEVLTAMNEPGRAASHYRRALRHAARLRSWPLVKRIASGTIEVAPGSDRTERKRRLNDKSLPVSDLPRVINELEMALAPMERP